MTIFGQAQFLLNITHAKGIARCYFVVNGFDGALTMLGMLIGFIANHLADFKLIINVCLGAAIALGMSGLSSAFISESAERQRELHQLEQAMIKELGDTAHGEATRWVPLMIALVNGLAPLLISVIILTPLWMSVEGIQLPINAIYCSVIIALLLVFLLGVFLGKIAQISWWLGGSQALVVAIVTTILIYLVTES